LGRFVGTLWMLAHAVEALAGGQDGGGHDAG
jgi:hypothetical protein